MTDSPLEKKQPLEKRPAPGAPADADLPVPGPEAGSSPRYQAGSVAAVRASDADRDRVADILREALAEGRLDAEEHSERLDVLYAAKTMGELEPLVRDLPQPRPGADGRPYTPGAEEEDDGTDTVIAVFSGATRKGRWRIGRRTNAFAMFGGIDIDLSNAVFTHREIVIHATALFGGVEVRVPENVTLRGKGAGIFGGFEVRSQEAPDPDAPVVVVKGLAAFGGVEARPKRGKRLRDLRKRES